jgi:hypothetical protein
LVLRDRDGCKRGEPALAFSVARPVRGCRSADVEEIWQGLQKQLDDREGEILHYTDVRCVTASRSAIWG